MVQPTDATQPLPKVDAESTQEMPILPPTVAPAVPVIATPAFDQRRAHVLHTHTVLGRILRTPSLPLPSLWEGHQYSTPALSLYLGSEDSIEAYQGVFGGEVTTEDRDSAVMECRARLDKLTTVIDGLDVVVTRWTYLPEEKPEPAPVEPTAAEPEPVHEPAPAPQPETPAEHPEAA